MSGGHYHYVYRKVDEVSDQIVDECNAIMTDESSVEREPWEEEDHKRKLEQFNARLKMSRVLRNVATAMRNLEWYDSADDDDWDAVVKSFENVFVIE